MMKKLTSLLLSAALMISLLACGASAAKTKSGVRIAGLKGPTTMGLVNLLDMERSGKASQHYDLQLYGAADEIVPKLIKGELDMAAIPANLAATLYQKTNGGIQVMAVNTLGVLYVVEKGDSIHSFADLKGRTILSTGKGTTPEYVLRYLLTKNGLDPDKDVKIEYYSEASEVTAQMAASKKDAIAVLPQPYVTAAQLKDSSLRVVLDLTTVTPSSSRVSPLSARSTPKRTRTSWQISCGITRRASRPPRQILPVRRLSARRPAWWPKRPLPRRRCPSATSFTVWGTR